MSSPRSHLLLRGVAWVEEDLAGLGLSRGHVGEEDIPWGHMKQGEVILYILGSTYQFLNSNQSI